MLHRVLVLVMLLCASDGARILAVYPTPSISHQVVFRPLTQELLKKGHELVVITTDPMYPKGETPANLTKIDFHDRSYKMWRDGFLQSAITQGKNDDFIEQARTVFEIMGEVLLDQITSVEVQNILNDTRKFDLLILEAYLSPILALTHVYKNVPTVLASSLGSSLDNMRTVGAPTQRFLHPTLVNQRVFNLTFWEKLESVYLDYYTESTIKDIDAKIETKLKKIFGDSLPSLEKLKNNVDMLFLNIHPIWELNRPVPPNVVFMGGLHQKPPKELPQDLKHYLDSSKHGVIYISFGTNVDPALLPPYKIQAMVNVLSKMQYDILWKWNHDELPGRTENIRISKWLPQSDLLRHPKIKLFITQGGLQSTDEAISAGVPLMGMPMLGDQWYNVEQYVYHKVGVHFDMETITEDKFRVALDEVLNNESYRRNMLRLRSIMRDQPQTPLERTVWWMEYVIRHGGAKHLRSPSANITWAQYLELELVIFLLALFASVIGVVSFILYRLFKFVNGCVFRHTKLKSS